MELSRTMRKDWRIHFRIAGETLYIHRFDLYEFVLKDGRTLISPVERVDEKLIWLFNFKNYKYTQIRIRDVFSITHIKECGPFEHSSNRYKKRNNIM